MIVRRSLLAALAVLIALPLLAAPQDASARAGTQSGGPGVVGDDINDAYVGTGGLIMPATVDDATRRTVAGCHDCQWRLESPCASADLGNAFDGQQTCSSVVRGCPRGELRRSWFRSEAGQWRDIGLICLRSQIATVASVGNEVRDVLSDRVPALTLANLPNRGVLTQIPTIFETGQPSDAFRARMLFGRRMVSVAAHARWTWDFGDGSTTVSTDAGDLARRQGAMHAYRASGRFGVTCRADWTAEFEVDGLGPFPVLEPVVQEAQMTVNVGEGRALLTP